MATPPPPPAPPPARVLAFSREFGFTMSRRSVPAGRLRLQLRNIGEDEHDLTIVGPNGTVRGWTGIVGPGRLGEIRARLSRGRYLVICTVAGHAAHGMRTTLTVTKRTRRARAS